jgi:hypothetical protein
MKMKNVTTIVSISLTLASSAFSQYSYSTQVRPDGTVASSSTLTTQSGGNRFQSDFASDTATGLVSSGFKSSSAPGYSTGMESSQTGNGSYHNSLEFSSPHGYSSAYTHDSSGSNGAYENSSAVNSPSSSLKNVTGVNANGQFFYSTDDTFKRANGHALELISGQNPDGTTFSKTIVK